MKKVKQYFFSVVFALTCMVAGIGIYKWMYGSGSGQQAVEVPPFQFSGYNQPEVYRSMPVVQPGAPYPDFAEVSAYATPTVVHVRSAFTRKLEKNPWMDILEGDPKEYAEQTMASGSGVIISDDGYIATNYHVVKGAETVEVTLNDNRQYVADVIGEDPSTDLALLKVDAKGLPHLKFGDPESVKVGEWVLAVGNPFNLTSTVTAGIISAKGRSLNILHEDYAIESFLQTDAVVNPGNSGGALVNTDGELIGINTAIASQTGTFTGYSFAVPANIVRKVMNDLKEFGVVQRAIIGIRIRDIDAKFADDMDLKVLNGAYVHAVIPEGSAADAGLKPGDVIVKINDRTIHNSAELQETVSLYSPGDVIQVTYMRGSKTYQVKVTLKNLEGNYKNIVKNETKNEEPVGAVYR